MDVKTLQHSFPGLQLLTISAVDVLPGSILNKNLHRIGHVTDLLGGTMDDFPTVWQNAQVANVSDTESHSGSAGIDILGIVKISGGGSSDLSASYTFAGVQEATFKPPFDRIRLRAKLEEIRQDKAKWQILLHKWVVTDTLGATSVVIEIKKGSTAQGELDLKKIGSIPEIDPKFDAKWSSDNKLVLTSPGNIPFAFFGIRPNA